jgi:hypothetical protein
MFQLLQRSTPRLNAQRQQCGDQLGWTMTANASR